MSLKEISGSPEWQKLKHNKRNHSAVFPAERGHSLYDAGGFRCVCVMRVYTAHTPN